MKRGTRNLAVLATVAFVGSAALTLRSFHSTINVLNGTPYNDLASKPEKAKSREFCNVAHASGMKIDHTPKITAIKYTPCN